jgi:hypothetical protein
MQAIPFLRSSLGLNTKVDPVRLPFDPETGVQYMAEAVNVDVDATGRISRRKGLEKITDLTGPHSLWSTRDESKCYVVSEDKLYGVSLDGSLTEIHDGLEIGAKAFYCEAGLDVFFSNTHEKGRIIGGSAWTDWIATPYVGTDTTRIYGGPAAGKHLFAHLGRVGYAVDNFLFYSEPLNYGCFDQVRGFIPVAGSVVIMTAAVGGGVFVSSDEGLFFLEGPLNDCNIRRVSPYPVVEGSLAFAAGRDFNPEISGDIAIFTLQTVGVCVGLGDGTLIRLTQDRVDMPAASLGFGVFDTQNDNRYTCFLEV